MNYVIPFSDELSAVVTFEVIPLPDNDYNIEVSSMTVIDAEDNEVFLSDFDYNQQQTLLETANEAIDKYIDDNHAALFEKSAVGTMPVTAKGWLH